MANSTTDKHMAPLSSNPDALTEGGNDAFLPEFILALLLVKSKPVGLSSREYMLQLRSCIRDEPIPSYPKDSNHVDTIAYWRNAYIKSEETQVQLRARIAELERSEEGVHGKSAGNPGPALSQRKRKRDSVNFAGASSNGTQKRANTRTTLTTSSAQDEGLQDCLNQAANPYNHQRGKSPVNGRIQRTAHKPGHSFIHQLYILQQVLAQRETNGEQLAAALCNACSGICQLISALQCCDDPQNPRAVTAGGCETHKHNQGAASSSEEHEDIDESKLLAIGEIFPCLLDGLNRMDSLPGGQSFRGQVIWNLVKIFDDLLNRICDLSAARVSQAPTTLQPILNTRTRSLQHCIADANETSSRAKTRSPCLACRERHRRCDDRFPSCQNCENWKIECKRGNALDCKNAACFNSTSFACPPKRALKFCELVIVMMTCLDTTKGMHIEVLEGFLFLLLRRVGQGLRRFVFESAEDGKLQQQQGLTNVDLRRRNSLGDDIPTNPQIIEAQAPCLIWILEQAKAFMANISQPSESDRSGHSGQSSNAKGRSTATSSSNILSTIAHRRLQHTLLIAVFGDQTQADFQPALEPPYPATSAEMSAKFCEGIRAEGVKDWFKHEVWRIVGWDVLKGHIRWRDDRQ